MTVKKRLMPIPLLTPEWCNNRGGLFFRTFEEIPGKMSNDFKIEFYGHRRLGAFRKRLYIVCGVILISVGLFGLFNQSPASNLFFLSLALLLGGIGNVVFALFDRRLLKERNYVRISSDKVKFKNSRQKPKSIRLKQLSDVIIQGQKAEFIKSDQSVAIYDFSGFPLSVGNEIATVLKSLVNVDASGANSARFV